eukprot:g23877.t1
MLNGYEQCKCHKGLSTSNHCEKPLAKLFSLSARMPAECRCDQTDPCEKFGAEAAGADRATGEVLCLCPEKFAAVASTKCSRPGQRVFSAVGNVLGCHCKQAGIYAKSVKSPVETAALAFCEAAAKMKEPLPSKADWLAECCTEYNVLKNSSREEMCNSVLSTHDADLASKNDLSQEGKDVAAAYLGQDFQLLWTQKGVDSEMGRNYTWLQPKPEAGKEVTDQLLQLQPNIRKKALNEGWFKEKKMESASLMQMRDTGFGSGSMRPVPKAPRGRPQKENMDTRSELFWWTGASFKPLRGMMLTKAALLWGILPGEVGGSDLM